MVRLPDHIQIEHAQIIGLPCFLIHELTERFRQPGWYYTAPMGAYWGPYPTKLAAYADALLEYPRAYAAVARAEGYDAEDYW